MHVLSLTGVLLGHPDRIVPRLSTLGLSKTTCSSSCRSSLALLALSSCFSALSSQPATSWKTSRNSCKTTPSSSACSSTSRLSTPAKLLVLLLSSLSRTSSGNSTSSASFDSLSSSSRSPFTLLQRVSSPAMSSLSPPRRLGSEARLRNSALTASNSLTFTFICLIWPTLASSRPASTLPLASPNSSSASSSQVITSATLVIRLSDTSSAFSKLPRASVTCAPRTLKSSFKLSMLVVVKVGSGTAPASTNFLPILIVASTSGLTSARAL